MTAQEEAQVPTQDGVPGGQRVVVVAFTYRLPERVSTYVDSLVAAGVEVDLVVPDDRALEDRLVDPRVRVHAVTPHEGRLLVRRVERIVLYRVPGGVLSRVRGLTERAGWRPLDAAVELSQRGHARVARAVHRRMFMPVYRHIRALLLARRADRSLAGLDIAGADRIIAADVHAITLGWRLARRYPRIPATTSLDASLYVTPGVGTPDRPVAG
jgi:hypothetical protein